MKQLEVLNAKTISAYMPGLSVDNVIFGFHDNQLKVLLLEAPNRKNWMLPGGFHNRKLSQLDMGGMGRWMMAREMRKKRVPDLPTLIDLAQELNVQLYVCDMSMSLMGIRQSELIDYPNLQCCGAVHFLEIASKANTTLFI